jgi:hypothetical protein
MRASQETCNHEYVSRFLKLAVDDNFAGSARFSLSQSQAQRNECKHSSLLRVAVMIRRLQLLHNPGQLLHPCSRRPFLQLHGTNHFPHLLLDLYVRRTDRRMLNQVAKKLE